MHSRLPTPDTPSSQSLVAPTKSTTTKTTSSALMTKSAPDTMPIGMPQTRRRAIRTYGKKRPLPSSADDSDRPTTAARTVNASVSDETTPEATSPSTSISSPVPPPLSNSEPDLPNHKRSGILRYFQPAPLPRSCSSGLSLSSQQRCLASSADEQPSSASTPPQSPPWSPPRTEHRRKRRLTIRADQLALEASDRPKEPEKDDDQSPRQRARTGEAGSVVASSVRMRARMRGANGPSRGSNSNGASTQTTLSLTVGGDAMKECRDCNILYNPLHEKDAKFHARYHASVVRREKTRRQRAENKKDSG